QRVDRHAQLEAGERLGVVHRLDAVDADHRPRAVKARAGDPQPLDSPAALDEQLDAGPESILGKISLRVDDDLAADAVRAGNPADQRYLVPLHRVSRISSITCLPSRSPAVDASVRSAAAVRPCRPISFGRSCGDTNSSISVSCLCFDSVTRTASGRSASALASTSTTARTPVEAASPGSTFTWPRAARQLRPARAPASGDS